MSFIALGVTGTVTAATAIAGASALAGAGMGAASMINASKQQKKAQNALEAQAKNSPLYKMIFITTKWLNSMVLNVVMSF